MVKMLGVDALWKDDTTPGIAPLWLNLGCCWGKDDEGLTEQIQINRIRALAEELVPSIEPAYGRRSRLEDLASAERH